MCKLTQNNGQFWIDTKRLKEKQEIVTYIEEHDTLHQSSIHQKMTHNDDRVVW